MIKAGLIGLNAISRDHKRAYQAIAENDGQVVLAAACDIRAECFADLDPSVRTYTSVDEMLEQEKGNIDYVDICVPTFLHAEIAIKAMEAGFHVMCEKPMARTVEQAQAMIDASKRTGKKLMIAHCNRFYEATMLAKDLIESGELGKVRSAEYYREGGSKNPMGWNNWFRDGELSGGVALDLHIHDVDVINWLFGMPKAVSVGAASVMTKNGYDALCANFYYDNGVFVHASSDWTIANDRFNTRTFRVNFEKGYLFCDRTRNRQAVVKVAEDGTTTEYPEFVNFNAFYNEIVYFVDCIKNDKPVTQCPPEQSAEAVRIIMAEIESADKGGELVRL